MKDRSLGLIAVQVAALRIFSAGLVFLPFAVFHFRKLPRNKIGLVILSAVFGNLLPAFLFASAMAKIDGSLGGILNSLTPLCVAVIAILFFHDKIGIKKIAGVLIGFLGLVLLTMAPVLMGEKAISYSSLGYILMIFLATLLYGINVNMVGHYLKNINAVHVATVSLAFMLIPTSIILWQQDFFGHDFNNPVTRNAVLASIALGVFGSAIATLLFYILVQKAGGLFASLVTYGIPFVALGWGLFDREKITWVQLASLTVILVGVYLANSREKTLENITMTETDS
jgi:drug/metabolite transporter (DMT)-like permease